MDKVFLDILYEDFFQLCILIVFRKETKHQKRQKFFWLKWNNALSIKNSLSLSYLGVFDKKEIEIDWIIIYFRLEWNKVVISLKPGKVFLLN